MAVQYCLTMSQQTTNESRKRTYFDPIEVYELPQEVNLKGAKVALNQFIESNRPDESYMCYISKANSRRVEIHYRVVKVEGVLIVVQIFEIGKMI